MEKPLSGKTPKGQKLGVETPKSSVWLKSQLLREDSLTPQVHHGAIFLGREPPFFSRLLEVSSEAERELFPPI